MRLLKALEILLNKKLINFNEPYLTGNELKYMRDVINRSHFYGAGFYTEKCQDLISKKIISTKILLTDSCTSALEMTALLLRDWDKEQEVILPSYTFSSTAAAYARAGFKIIFAEVNPKTMMLDIEDVKKKITHKTTAVIIVHYGGFSSDAFDFKELCDKNSVYLIEDSAQAFGSIEKGKFLGTIGDFGCFSFHETKNLHAGLSGALSINNSKFIDKAIHIWERGTNRQQVLKGLVDKYSWVEIGGSFYPSELQAAFLFAQLKSFDKNILERKKIFYGYFDTFINNQFNNFYFPDIQPKCETNFHAFWVMFLSSNECDFIRMKLLDNNINAYIGYVPLHSSEVGKRMGFTENDLPLTQKYSEQILRLPFHNNMSSKDSKMIAKLIINLLTEYRK